MAAIVTPGAHAGSFQKLFFGKQEIAIPQFGCTADATAAYPRADVFINFSSFRSAFESSMDALRQSTIRVVAIIAEGVPERGSFHSFIHSFSSHLISLLLSFFFSLNFIKQTPRHSSPTPKKMEKSSSAQPQSVASKLAPLKSVTLPVLWTTSSSVNSTALAQWDSCLRAAA